MHYDREYDIILKLLYNMRLNAGYTQTHLAQKLNVPQSYISKVENGEKRIDLIQLKNICNALNCSLADFIKEFQNKLNESK